MFPFVFSVNHITKCTGEVLFFLLKVASRLAQVAAASKGLQKKVISDEYVNNNFKD